MVKFVDPTSCDVIQDNVNKLDLQNGVIDIGNYCTCLPISPPEYREKHPTSAKIEVTETETEICFSITDDYEITYLLIITEEEMENPIVQDEVKKIKAFIDPPKSFPFEVKQTREELYQDWNFRTDKFGVISDEC